MKTLLPHQLPCFTTADEMRPIIDGLLVQALSDLMKQPTTDAPDLHFALNEKIWESGNKDLWLEEEIKRIKIKFKKP